MGDSCNKKVRFNHHIYIPFKYHLPNTRFVNHHKASLPLITEAEETYSNTLHSWYNLQHKKRKEFHFIHQIKKMKNQLLEQVIGVPIKSTTYRVERTPRRYLPDAGQYRISSSAEGSTTFRKSKGNFVLKRMNKLGKKADSFAHGVREHVRLGPKITETVKGKLSLGARILQVGGVEKIFKQLFSVREGEKLLKACQCYLSTTAGPIAGLLFISSQKVAFCSDRSIKIPSPNGEFMRVHYKVWISSFPLSVCIILHPSSLVMASHALSISFHAGFDST
ncbi:hypothetical protein REPUB_Repub01dG0149700 [Reevesia pubescens]